MRTRVVRQQDIAGEAGLIVVPGRRAADVANEVLRHLFDRRLGLDDSPVLVGRGVREVAISWRTCDLKVLAIGQADEHGGVWRVTHDWPSQPIWFQGIGVRAARDERAALLRKARSRNLEPVWLVGAAPSTAEPTR